MTHRAAIVCLVLAGSNCTPSNDSPAIQRIDSAGVAIIQYTAAFKDLPYQRWSTAPEPLYSFGGPSFEFHQVIGAVFQSDGRVVVGNSGSHELLFFESKGNLAARIGGDGGGPGEFRQLMSIVTGPNDSVFAYDRSTRSVSVFGPTGAFARTVVLRDVGTLGNVEEIGVSRTGEIVAAFFHPSNGTGIVQDSLIVATIRPDGGVGDSLGVFPLTQRHWGPHEIPGSSDVVAIPLPLAFAGVAAADIGPNAVHIGLPDAFSLIRMDYGGTRRITRAHFVPEPVTEAHRDHLFGALAGGRGSAAELQLLRSLPGANTIPPFGHSMLTARIGEPALVVTDAAEVWLRPFGWIADDSSEWLRFNNDGVYAGTITLPSRFIVTAVRGNVVLGVYRNVDDVEFVQGLQIVE